MERKILDFLSQYIIALISVIITVVLFWYYQPSDTIPIKVFMLFVIPLGICVLVAIPQLVKYWTVETQNIVFPRLKTVVQDVLVFDASNLFSIQCIVTLFYIDDNIERNIGYGYVETIKSDNKYLQVKLVQLQDGYDKNVLEKNKKHILIKPNCPYERMGITIDHSEHSEEEYE